MKKIVTFGLALMLVLTLGLVWWALYRRRTKRCCNARENGTPLGRAWGHMRAGFGVISEVIENLLGLTHDEIMRRLEVTPSLRSRLSRV